MRSENEQQEQLTSTFYRELQLLSEIDDAPVVTQRQLSLKMGIALGLTNVMLRNLIQKGYLRVSNASWKQRFYNLTPDGLAHKIHLTKRYVTKVLDHYQNVRQTLREQMAMFAVNEESRCAIYGTNEFAELVFLGLREFGIEEIDIFSHDLPAGSRFLGMPVHNVAAINFEDYDKVFVAMLDGSQEMSDELLRLGVSPHKVATFYSTPIWGPEE